MLPRLRAHSLKSVLLGAGFALTIAAPTEARSEAPVLSEQTMAWATDYLGIITDRPISADDAAWLKQRWVEQHAITPHAVADWVDQLALGLERHEREPDPLALASSRQGLIKQTYCDAEQTSDPDIHRLRTILAPDDLVLAADCVFGMVVTRFDVDGLASSHALAAAIAGQSHDPAADRAAVAGEIAEQFAAAEPAGKQILADGELRHAFAARFWSRIDGQPRQAELAATLGEQASQNLMGTARNLEQLAMQKLGEVDYVASAGEARLTGAMIGEYQQWLEHIAGYSFASRDQAWLEDAITDEFSADPNKMAQEIASIKQMNRDYAIADSAEEKASLLATMVAGLHCYLATSSDQDEIRLAEVVFRHDPVVSADCEGGRIVRKRDAVLAEADGQTLTERRIEPSLRTMAILLGRPLTPEEEAFARDDSIREFKGDPTEWQRGEADIKSVLGEIDKHSNSNLFLGIDTRKKLFDPVYCDLKQSDEPSAPTYLAMFEKDGAIVSEDCSATRVTTREEIDAFIDALNFLAFIAGEPIFSEAQRAELAEGLADENLSNSESALAGLTEWWSLLNHDEKSEQVAKLREVDITNASDAGNVLASYVKTAKLKTVLINAKRNSCRLSAIISRGNAAIFAAKAPTMSTRSMGIELATSIPTNNALAKICGGG